MNYGSDKQVYSGWITNSYCASNSTERSSLLEAIVVVHVTSMYLVLMFEPMIRGLKNDILIGTKCKIRFIYIRFLSDPSGTDLSLVFSPSPSSRPVSDYYYKCLIYHIQA